MDIENEKIREAARRILPQSQLSRQHDVADPKRQAAYWRERYNILNAANAQLARQTYNDVERAFELAQRDIQRDIDAWLNRFAANNGVTLVEARKLLNSNELKEFKWDVAEYIKRGRENAINGKWAKELENASARLHISRLEALKIRTQNHLETAFAAENQAVEKLVKDAYKNGYYRTCYELQRGLGVGFDVAGIDERTLDMLVKKPWTVDGRTFFDRIWERNDKMVGALHQEMIRNCIYGRSREEMTKALEQYIKKDVKNAKYCAARIVTTECAYFSSESQFQALSALGCEMYEIYLPLDEKSCDVCREMNGRRFKLSEYSVGATAPPFHPNCVDGSIIPCFEDDFAIDGSPISENMPFEEWEKKFVKDNGLTNGGDDGIMKMGKANHEQSVPDFSKYPVADNEQAVEELRKQIIADFGLKDSDVNLGGIKNTEVLQPFFTRMQKIVRDTGMKMPSVYAAEIIEGDVCCIASFKPGENRLYISSKFFNSKAAIEDTLRDWASKGIMPVQCKSIAYIAEHEAAHIRIPNDMLKTIEAVRIFNNRKLRNKNDRSIFEYFADVTAIYRLNPNINDKNILEAIDYLKDGGVLM